MIDRLLAFLKDLPGGTVAADNDRDNPRVAAAALMVHLMDADGLRLDAEVGSLREALTNLFGVTDGDLERLVEAGEKADSEAVDLYAFTSVIKRHLDAEARGALVGILWDVVYADGERHELEDNLVWRIAELIGVDSRERIELRRRAARAAGASGD
ncbi:hypothetical protein RHIZO_04613 [Rhizobiaceae bacterium]|nr:hypothetical protein RHIZO_04613 [Rhizobiaceae bacterium]